MRVVFMGSPDFAVPCLEALHRAHEVALVVSQPDKPAGRGAQLAQPAVKQAALALGLPVIQPRSARTGELAEAMAKSGAELAVVVAYGKILPPAVLGALPRGCINVHASLLPRWRGAAPIQWSVIAGDAETGVAIMQLDEGMDTGPVYLMRTTPIGADETSGELFARLAPMGAAALLEGIDAIAAGARATAQVGEPTHARMLEKTDGVIDFARPAADVAARIRGVDPWPGAQAQLRGAPVKIFRAHTVTVPAPSSATPGAILSLSRDGAVVACGGGAVLVREVQVAGKKRMPWDALAVGRGVAVGDVLA
ncbi:MAG TPA: methionyl-tRNA formyltransferase [Kofleriaceae bacterium]